MYGTLRGALAGRKIEFDRDGYTASVEGRIVGIGKTIRIASIHVHYELAVPADAREATERALAAHPQGCPAHQSVKDAIAITWAATLRAGEEVLTVRSEVGSAHYSRTTRAWRAGDAAPARSAGARSQAMRAGGGIVRCRVARSGTGAGGREPRGASRPGPPAPPALASLDRC